KIGTRLLQRYLWFETPDRNEPGVLAALGIRRIHKHRRPEIHIPILKKKRRRHHANDGTGQLTEAKRFADRCRVGIESPAPEPIADQHRVRAAEAAFFRSEIAAKSRRNTQNLQKTRRDKCLLHAFRKRSGKFGTVLSVVPGYP